MVAQRLIETTLKSGDVAASFIYIARPALYDNVFVAADTLGIQLPTYPPEQSPDKLLGLAAKVIAAPVDLRSLYGTYGAPEVDLSSVWVKDILLSPDIIIANSPPFAADFASLAAKGSGAAIGAYVGVQAGLFYPPIMLVTVPLGMIICGSAMGVANALERGLRDRIFSYLVPSPAVTLETPATPKPPATRRPRS